MTTTASTKIMIATGIPLLPFFDSFISIVFLFNGTEPLACTFLGEFGRCPFYLLIDPVRIEPVLTEQQLCVAMRDDPVGHAHPDNFDLVLQSICLEQFHHRGTKAAGQICLLDSNDQTVRSCDLKKQFGV